jgi:hypothetical protein
VAAARRDGRERHLTLFVPSRPDSATNDATGRLTLLWGRSWGMTARSSAGGKFQTEIVTFLGPFHGSKYAQEALGFTHLGFEGNAYGGAPSAVLPLTPNPSNVGSDSPLKWKWTGLHDVFQ